MSEVTMPTAILSFLVNQTFTNLTHLTTPVSSTTPLHALIFPTLASQQSSSGPKTGRSSNRFEGLDSLDATHRQFVQIADPVALVMGIVGNALLTLVFLVTPLRLRPLNHTFAGLGVVNLLYTISCLLIYLTKKGVTFYNIPGACQVSTFMLVFSKSIEAWLIFIAHLNRLNAHTNAGNESRRRRVFNTKFAIILASLLVAAPLLHVLWSVETVTYGDNTFCVPMKETIYIHLTIRKLELIVSVFLPLTLIAGVDMMLVLKLAVLYVFREEEDEDDFNIVHDSPSSINDHRAPTPEHCAPHKDIVYVHTGARLSTIDELSSSSVGKSNNHHLNDSIYSARSDHAQRKGSSGDNKSLLLDLGGRQSGEATSPISFHFLFDSLSPSGNRPNHTGLSIDSLNTHDSKSRINTPDIDDYAETAAVANRINNECIIVNVEIVKSNQSEEEVKKFQESHLDMNRLTESATPSNFYSFVLSNLKFNNCKRVDSYKLDFSQDSFASSEPRRYKASSMNNSFSGTQWRSYTCASYASNTSRTPTPQEDHSFPTDVSACTVSTMMVGILYAALFLPSSYSQAVSLFTDTPTRPAAIDIQQALLYETLIKLNAAYKCVLYFCLMPSFRYAIMWLLNQWFQNKMTRVSNMCIWSSKRQKNESVYV